MEIAIVAAGFTPAEADGLRRSMATFKAKGKVSDWETKLVGGMMAKGYEEDFARRVFRQLEGFGSYGFPESHAASFALLVYISSWIKHHYPDVFAAAILNSLPMGFYQPAQLVADARKHGVTVRPVDVNYSAWDHTLEGQEGHLCPLRLGFRLVKGLKEEEMQVLIAARDTGYTGLHQMAYAGVSQAALEHLADADAFRSMGLNRRQALWEVAALADLPRELFKGQATESAIEPEVQLPVMKASEQVLQDYNSTSLSLKAHPVSFVRQQLYANRILATRELEDWPDGTLVRVAGLVLVRQRPGTATGICFITIEDETGIANLVVFRNVFEKYRKQILQARLLMVSGHIQCEGKEGDTKVIHVVVRRCFDMTWMLQGMISPEREALPVKAMGDMQDVVPAPAGVDSNPVRKVVQGELFPSRNFK